MFLFSHCSTPQHGNLFLLQLFHHVICSLLNCFYATFTFSATAISIRLSLNFIFSCYTPTCRTTSLQPTTMKSSFSEKSVPDWRFSKTACSINVLWFLLDRSSSSSIFQKWCDCFLCRFVFVHKFNSFLVFIAAVERTFLLFSCDTRVEVCHFHFVDGWLFIVIALWSCAASSMYISTRSFCMNIVFSNDSHSTSFLQHVG